MKRSLNHSARRLAGRPQHRAARLAGGRHRRVRKNTVWGVLFVAVLGAWWATLAPRVVGGPTTWAVVAGTSMLPRYHTGDLVVAHRAAEYHLGEIVVVSVDGGHVVHQLFAGDARTGWTTKGINKNTPDLWTIPNRDVLGRAWFMVPNVGNDLRWLGTAGGRLVAAGGLALFVAAWPRKRRVAEPETRPPGQFDRPLSILLVTASAGLVAAVVAWTGAHAVGLHGILRVAGVGTMPLYWGLAAVALLSPSLPLLAYYGARTRSGRRDLSPALQELVPSQPVQASMGGG